MAPTTTLPLITISLLLFSSSLTISHCIKITTRLIHRDSRFSPLYDATETTADRARKLAHGSLARYASLSNDVGIEAPLVLSNNLNIFYVNFSIGEPPAPQLAVMDTGSSLTWVKCLPCRPCSPGSGATFFDPYKSKTYYPHPCTKDCKKCAGSGNRDCMYQIDYLVGHYSEGVYATDQLTFRTSDDGVTTIPKVQFGCCSLVTGMDHFDRYFTGVLALGGVRRTAFGEKSLVFQLGSTFSYCIGSVFDRSYPYNRLSIGGDADMAGESTPFHNDEVGHYFVQLQNISLGGQILDIDSQVFSKISHGEGIAIDSGTELTFLYAEAFDVVEAEIKNLASSSLTEVLGPSPFELCYKGSVNQEARGFPALGFHFKDGAELIVDSVGLFLQVEEGIFCLGVLRSQGLSIVGIMAQQGYNVGYDLKSSRVYFQDIDCQLLEG